MLIPLGLDVSVIIINWKSVDFLRKCLCSIYANTKDIRFEIIVIDNASRDGCGEMIQREFPTVRFIQGNENLGFARANNLGFRYSSGRNILILNPDTEVVGSAIEIMLRFLDATPGAGIVGAKLLNSDRSIQTSCIRAFPTIVNEFLDSAVLRGSFPRSRLWGTRPLFAANPEPTTVDAVSGACLMIRREAFEEVGLFTAAYFMYAEDLDLCFKVRHAGWTNYFVPSATVIHHGGQSTGSMADRNFADVAMRESRLRFFRERKGKLYALIYRLTTQFVALCRLLLLGGVLIFPLGTPRRHSVRRAFLKWIRIFRWSIGMEEWVRQLNR